MSALPRPILAREKCGLARRRAAFAAVALLAIGGCARPVAEAPRGADEYSKILAEYGGAYADAKLASWVGSVGETLARHCGRPDIAFSFTVLDSGGVNAFSTPGGYIYVTRGLLALANSEAEIAAVLGHEMGHVIAGHHALRYDRSRGTGVGALLLGALSGSRELAALAEGGPADDLAGFSREQEYEADAIGIRIAASAGYEPRAMAVFLAALERDAALYDRIAGGSRPGSVGYIEDHPLTSDRVARAEQTAAEIRHLEAERIGRDTYLGAVDGIPWGNAVDQGYARGRFFIHPRAGFLFEVPPGFLIENSASAVIATRADGAAIVLTSATPGTAASPFDYLRRIWAPRVALGEIAPLTVNGHSAAAASAHVDSDRGQMDVRLVAIGWSPWVVYRLMLITPPTATPAGDLERVVDSFRSLGPSEIGRYPQPRIRVIRVRKRDTLAALAGRMAFEDFRADWLRAINGLDEDAALTPGEQIKLVE